MNNQIFFNQFAASYTTTTIAATAPTATTHSQEAACVMIKPGVNRDGWWASEDLVEQIEKKAIQMQLVFLHLTMLPAIHALIATRLNLGPG
ncbi:9065_t:CDS:2, partial [Entrophospora sp. SA101]